MLNQTIGFIGCGNMGGAIIKGLLASETFSKEQIMASTISETDAAPMRD